jgi:hypothetical protein
MFYSNIPIVKQRNHGTFPLSNKPFNVCIGKIQVFLDGPIRLDDKFPYNSLCAIWQSSQLFLLEIPLRTNVKGNIHFQIRKTY